MKIHPLSKIITGAVTAILLVATAITSHAGPPPEVWNRASLITTVRGAEAVKPDDPIAMVCGAGKTAMIRDSRQVGSPSKSPTEWFTLGLKHQCDLCGGEISVVPGKIPDSVQHNCRTGGEGAPFCCSTAAPIPQK